MYNRKSNRALWFFLGIILSNGIVAQSSSFSFNLMEAQQYAIEHSYISLSADKDVEISEKKVSETISTGLPQINAVGNYQKYIQTPLQLIPAEFTGGAEGDFVEVFFGTEQQVSAGLRVDQLLFSGSYFVGLQAAKTYLQLSKNDKKKSDIEVKNMVTTAYGNVLVAMKNIEILNGNVKNLERSVFEAEELYKNGFIEEQDKDQLTLTLANVKNNYEQAARSAEVVKNQLKFILGIEITSTVMLTDDLKTVTTLSSSKEYLNTDFNANTHIDYQIVSTQENATELLLKQQKSPVLPSLSGFYTAQTASFSDEFDFFDRRYYSSHLVGLNLNIPIFSGFGRTTRIQQAKLNLEKASLAKKQVEQQLQINAQNSKSAYTFALSQYNTTENNLALAERIYKKTKIKYEEGISSSLELTQANNQLLETQSKHIQAAFELIQAKSNLDKAFNQ